MKGQARAVADVFPGRGAAYWEQRARRFASDGTGLAAVCSYGMPGFYNRLIDATQKLALKPWLRPEPEERVLDVGCGVGRWSRWLACRGALVTGVDLSATMIGEARRRAESDGLGERCRFVVGDVASLDESTHGRFDRIVSVTVLQHVLDDEKLYEVVAQLGERLTERGRLVLLEAAPTRERRRCDTPVFVARTLDVYREAVARAGLQCERITGVDPAPFKTWLLPRYRTLPRPIATLALAAATAAAAPIDLALGRRWVDPSWHKVIVARRPAS